MTKILQKNRNKRKQRNEEKGVENGTKYIISLIKKIQCQLVKNFRNSQKKQIKNLMIIKNLMMKRNKRNQKSVDVEEKNGMKLIMNSNKNFRCL